jgi:hypothetical protein
MESPQWGDTIDGYDEGDGWLKCWVKVRKGREGEVRLSLHFLGRRFFSEKLSSGDPATFPGTFRVQVPISDDAEALSVLDESELGVEVVEWVEDPWPHWRTIWAGRALFQDLFRYVKGKDRADDGTTNYETISAYSGFSRPVSEPVTEATDRTPRTPRDEENETTDFGDEDGSAQKQSLPGLAGWWNSNRSTAATPRPGQTKRVVRSLTELLPEGIGSSPAKVNLFRPWDEAGQFARSPETLELRTTGTLCFLPDHACISPELQGRGVLTTLYSAHRGMWYDPSIGQKSFHVDNVANFVELNILDLMFPPGDRPESAKLFLYFVEASICGINVSTVPLHRPHSDWKEVLSMDPGKIDFQGTPLVLPLPPGFWCFHGEEKRPTIELTVLRIAKNDLDAITFRELQSRSGKRAREMPSLERVYHANLVFDGLLVDQTREGVGVRLSKATQAPTEAHVATGDSTKVEDPATVRLNATLRDRDYVRLEASASAGAKDRSGGRATVAVRTSPSPVRAEQRGQQAVFCVGDKVLLPVEEPLLYPRDEVEFRKRLVPGTYKTNAWEASLLGNERAWYAPLRDPYMSHEYEASGLDKLSQGKKVSQRMIPRDCYDTIPHKYVMPRSELDFLQEGRPGVFWRVASKLAENPRRVLQDNSNQKGPMVVVDELSHVVRQVPCTVLAVYSDRTCDLEIAPSFLIEWEQKPWKRFKIPGVVVVKEFELPSNKAAMIAGPGQGDTSEGKRLRVLLREVPVLDVVSVQATSFNIYDARLGTTDDAISIDPRDFGNDFNPCAPNAFLPAGGQRETGAATNAGDLVPAWSASKGPPGSKAHAEEEEDPAEIRGGYSIRAGPLPFDVGEACQHEWSLHCHAKSEDEMYQFVATLRQMAKLDLHQQMKKLKDFKTDIASRQQFRTNASSLLSAQSGTLDVVLVETRNLRPLRVQQHPNLMTDRSAQQSLKNLNVMVTFRLKSGNLEQAPDEESIEHRYLPKEFAVKGEGWEWRQVLVQVEKDVDHGSDDDDITCWRLSNDELKSKQAFFPYFMSNDDFAARDAEGPTWGTIVKGEDVGEGWIRCEIVKRWCKFLKDEKVESFRRGGRSSRQRYGATIKTVNADGSYTIKWDDGYANDLVKQGQELTRKDMEAISYKGSKQQNSPVLQSSSPNWSEDKELGTSGGWVFKTPVLDPSKMKGTIFELEIINKKAYSTETIGFVRMPLSRADPRTGDLPHIDLCKQEEPFHNIWLPLSGHNGESVSGEVHIMTLWLPKNPSRSGRKKLPATAQKFMERNLGIKMHQMVPREPVYNVPIREMGYNPNLWRDDAWPESLAEATSYHVQTLFSKAPYLACCERQVRMRLEQQRPEFERQLDTLKKERQSEQFEEDPLEWERSMKVDFYELNELLRRGLPPSDRKQVWLELMGVDPMQQECYAGSFMPDESGDADIDSAIAFYKELVTKGQQRSSFAMAQLNEDFITAACWERSEAPNLIDMHMKRLQRTHNLCTALITFSNVDESGSIEASSAFRRPSELSSGHVSAVNMSGGNGVIYSESLLIIAFHLLLAFEPLAAGHEQSSGDVDWEDEARAFWIIWALAGAGVSGEPPYGDYYGALPLLPPKYEAPPEALGSAAQADSGDWGRGAMRDIFCLGIILEREEHDLWVHLNALGFHLSTVFYGAFMRLFAMVLPISSLFRFWDILFADLLRPSRRRRALVELAFASLRECKPKLMRCASATEARDCLLSFLGRLYDEAQLVQLVAKVEGDNLWGGVLGRGIGWKDVSNYVPKSGDQLSMMQTYEQTLSMWHVYFEHTRYQNHVLKELMVQLDNAAATDGDADMRATTRSMMRVIIPKLQNQSNVQNLNQVPVQFVGLMRQTPPRLYEVSSEGGFGQLWRQTKQSFSMAVNRREAARLDLKLPFLVGVPPSAGARGEPLLDKSVYDKFMQQALGTNAPLGTNNLLSPKATDVWHRHIPELGGKFSRNPDHRLCLYDIYMALICCSRGTIGEKAVALFDLFGTVQPAHKIRHVIPIVPSAGIVIQQVEGASNAKSLMAAPSNEDERKMALHFRVFTYSGTQEMILGDAYVPDLHPFATNGLGSQPMQNVTIWGVERDIPKSAMALARGPARLSVGEMEISIQWISSSKEQPEVGQLCLHLSAVRLDVDRPERKNPRVTVVGRDERGAEIQFKREQDTDLARGAVQYMSVVARDMAQASLEDHIGWPAPMWVDPMSHLHSYRGLGEQGWDKAAACWKWSPRWGIQFSVKGLQMPGTTDTGSHGLGEGAAKTNPNAISLAACRAVTRGILERSLHCVTNRQAALISDQAFSRAGAVPGILDAVLVRATCLTEDLRTVAQLREQLKEGSDFIEVKYQVTIAHENQVALSAGKLNFLTVQPTALRGPHGGELPLSMASTGSSASNTGSNTNTLHLQGAAGWHVTYDPHALEDKRGFPLGSANSTLNPSVDLSAVLGPSLGRILGAFPATDPAKSSSAGGPGSIPGGPGAASGRPRASLENINIQDPFRRQRKVLWIRFSRAGDGQRINAKISVDEDGWFDIDKHVRMDMETDSSVGQVQTFISKEEFVNCILTSPLLGETLRRLAACAGREVYGANRQALNLDIIVADPDKAQQDEDFSDMISIGQKVLFEIWDYDRTSRNDFLGECWLPPLSQLTSGQRKNFRINIGNAEQDDTRPDTNKTSHPDNKGVLAVEALWTFPAETVPDVPVESIEERVKVEEKLHTGVLRLRIIEAENIRAADDKRKRRTSDAYVRCYIQNETINSRKSAKKVYGFDHDGFRVNSKTGFHEPFHTTKTQMKTLNPVWNEAATITVKTGAFEMKTTQNARANAFSTQRQVQEDLDRRVLASSAEVEIKFRDRDTGSDQSHGVRVYLAETVYQFKEKLKMTCKRMAEENLSRDDAEKSRLLAVANSMSSRHLVMVFVPSDRLRELKQQRINFGREYNRLERMEHMDPSHWQPLDPIRTFASYAKEYGFGTEVQQLQIIEASPAYAVKNVRYRRFEEERRTALKRQRLEDLNTEAECYGFAKYVHQSDGNSTEWRPLVVQRADEQHARSGKLLGTFVHAPLAGATDAAADELREFDRSDVLLAPARPLVLATILLEHKELLAKAQDLRESGLDERAIRTQLNEEMRQRWLRKQEMEEREGKQPTPCPPEITLADVAHALSSHAAKSA